MKKENLLLAIIILLVSVAGFFAGKYFQNDSGRFVVNELHADIDKIMYFVTDSKEGIIYVSFPATYSKEASFKKYDIRTGKEIK